MGCPSLLSASAIGVEGASPFNLTCLVADGRATAHLHCALAQLDILEGNLTANEVLPEVAIPREEEVPTPLFILIEVSILSHWLVRRSAQID